MQIIDGKSIALEIRAEIAAAVKKISGQNKRPGLAVILVGEDPASQVYVRMKGKACETAGIYSVTDRQPAAISQMELLALVDKYNADPAINGLLVQLPLPNHIDEQKIIEHISPIKDVDCFHPYNVGRLMIGKPIFEPATPAGIMKLIEKSGIETSGKNAVVVGRSNIVGKPIAMMLARKAQHANAIVTIAHSAATDISQYTRDADILIAAIGRPEMIRGEMIKPGAVIIDVGVNRVDADNEKGYKLVGDVHFEEAAEKAAAITPVPGGVGPMTIAMLLWNTVKAFELQNREE